MKKQEPHEPKDVEVKARVSASIRAALASIARNRREGLSVIVREAINEYLERRAEEIAADKVVTLPSPRRKIIYPKAQEKKKHRA